MSALVFTLCAMAAAAVTRMILAAAHKAERDARGESTEGEPAPVRIRTRD